MASSLSETMYFASQLNQRSLKTKFIMFFLTNHIFKAIFQ